MSHNHTDTAPHSDLTTSSDSDEHKSVPHRHPGRPTTRHPSTSDVCMVTKRSMEIDEQLEAAVVAATDSLGPSSSVTTCRICTPEATIYRALTQDFDMFFSPSSGNRHWCQRIIQARPCFHRHLGTFCFCVIEKEHVLR